MQPDLDTAMAAGDLIAVRAILDDAAANGGDPQLLIDGYADLAQTLDRRGDHDAAIDALQHAIGHGYDASPDPRSDIAEYHLRAGRADVAADIWAELREEMPDDLWLYNAAGLTYHADAIFGDATQPARPFAASEQLPMSLAWFPAGEYERALSLWPSLAEDWGGVPHEEYCARMHGHARWLRAQGARVHAISPLPVDELIAYGASHDLDPEESRAAFAAEQSRIGRAVPWPPARNQPCWCGSQRKYKKCCAAAPTVPMHLVTDDH